MQLGRDYLLVARQPAIANLKPVYRTECFHCAGLTPYHSKWNAFPGRAELAMADHLKAKHGVA